jgi:hypothetical protein
MTVNDSKSQKQSHPPTDELCNSAEVKSHASANKPKNAAPIICEGFQDVLLVDSFIRE